MPSTGQNGQEARWRAGTAFAFAVVDGRGTVLGHVAVSAIDRRHSTGWLSYWTTRAARGRGAASAACRSLARRAFDDAGPSRLELGHRVDNRVLPGRRCGRVRGGGPATAEAGVRRGAP
ncbi:GNAT family N-acetyltransferase [Streptomyces sp. WP-1]|uniref:GNAT family N-acetyltransferase n=1 Tax=Streptomyces sp. WP-1 TaxID=3041497 RepID=UPI0026479FFE|nr:GNAT family N-acetyltransferase [Streptomyces sp. WP-1]WKE73669.1 GNAT family N-acetyltransferase [Streptomyces sp. WP-1]